MALRLRKDVQKASYYVWFLGAEEARGLRGPRILLSAIPYLVERSRELEPIKVTLQVSHKGMKIIQVNFSFQHFYLCSSLGGARAEGREIARSMPHIFSLCRTNDGSTQYELVYCPFHFIPFAERQLFCMSLFFRVPHHDTRQKDEIAGCNAFVWLSPMGGVCNSLQWKRFRS